jgi:hypothetical protein
MDTVTVTVTVILVAAAILLVEEAVIAPSVAGDIALLLLEEAAALVPAHLPVAGPASRRHAEAPLPHPAMAIAAVPTLPSRSG